MKVLVTGSAGKLGKAIVQKLLSAGIGVLGADVIESPTTHVLLDIRDKKMVSEICLGIDAIIHTAAVHGKHFDLNYPREDFLDTNVYGTLNLLNAAVANRVQKFLYISTTSIYGDSMVDDTQAVWVDEQLPARPRDIYDISKQTAEELCRDFFYKEGLQTSVYRVGRFLPENPNLEANHRLYRGLDERDGAEALYLALNKTFADFEVFNIASSSPFGKQDLVKLKTDPREVILTYYPQAEAIYAKRNWTFPASIDRVYNYDKAKKLLGYSPKYTFEKLLED
ncbi:NAD(P)-dependent oxidoreductase [Mucilaginibacter sp. RS28]|uniref:NAD(P)-dependent oxidoreductase n=1 Tax=Mucilaginibacter straminoryzae TaxID=2932774 RepID=A0A9X2BDQ2_9SPHI|nr:NAD(P)-dependent oxidoreductase [Mucilaginibacter straminoryzae]MCJ8210573.1 NAD(P)-dependent oxidoreductase [Mucilaginibacter straminoryzae]